MKKLILLFFVFWSAIVDAAVIYHPPIRIKDPTLLATYEVVWCIATVSIIIGIITDKLDDNKKPKDEKEKLNKNRVGFSKKTKPVNEKFKKYEIYTSKNFKKKK